MLLFLNFISLLLLLFSILHNANIKKFQNQKDLIFYFYSKQTFKSVIVLKCEAVLGANTYQCTNRVIHIKNQLNTKEIRLLVIFYVVIFVTTKMCRLKTFFTLQC